MKTKNKGISKITLVALTAIVVVMLGMLAFSLKNPIRREYTPNSGFPQPLRGIVTQVEQGKDGVQVKLQTEDLLYNVTISKVQAELNGSFDQIVVGAGIEVTGQEITGIDPPLIVAEYVRVLAAPTNFLGITWELTAYNDQQPINEIQPTLRFETDQITGNTGCNHYGGSYKVTGGSVKFEGIYSTEMACVDIPGIMDQERMYLEILGAAQSIELVDGLLTIFAENGQTLTFLPLPDIQTGQDLPADSQTSVSQTNPAEEAEPTLPSASVELPAGFKEYRDSQTGISIHIPDEWHVQNQSIIDGEYAIFSSYPPDKYIGGELREPGDTKCDLNLNSSVRSVDELVQQWKSSTITSIISEEEIILNSGNSGTKFVIDSMGHSTIMVTKINGSLVTFSCWGEFDHFDEIAVSLRSDPDSSP